MSRIFNVSSSTGHGIEGCRTCWKDEIGHHTLGMKAQSMHQLRVLGLNNKPSTSCHCPLLLTNGSYALALDRDNKQFWGLNNKPSTSCHWFLCFGTRPRHQTRAPWLGLPRLKKGKSYFFTNRNILHTLKNEPLNIMHLHTGWTMDGP